MTQTPARADVVETRGDEATLIARIREGDTKAYEVLFRTHYGLLCDYAYGFLRSRTDAEEVVEGLLSDLWMHRERWAVPASLRAYLYTATRNRALRLLEQSQRFETEAPQLSLPARQASILDPAEHRALQQALEEAVAELPARCRQAYLLRAVHELSYADIAQVMGTSVKTVEMQLWKALKQLRIRLAQWYE